MKKRFLLLLTIIGLLLAACSSGSESQSNSEGTSSAKTINLGIQQILSPLWIAKEKGWLEEAFKEVGVEIVWTEFQSGPPQFEGIAAGKLDITEVGNTPPLSGQAAGIDFKEIALLSKGKTNNAVLIPEDSDIKSIKDLVGKKLPLRKEAVLTVCYMKRSKRKALIHQRLKLFNFNRMRLNRSLKMVRLMHGLHGNRLFHIRLLGTMQKH